MLDSPNRPESEVSRKRSFLSRLSGRAGRWTMLVLFSASLTAGTTGCRLNKLNVSEALMVSYRDMVWAKRAYNLRYGNCDRPFGEHYYNGFCTGFEDVCNGGDGYVPALPPMAYRSHRFQSEEGAKCVNAWFEGYPAGVAAAREEKAGQFNNVLVSRMIDSAVVLDKNVDRALPSDVKITPAAETPVDSGIEAAPPHPDAISLIEVPQRDYRQSSSAKTSVVPPEPIQTLPMMVEQTRHQTELPPIVTGSGIAREARVLPKPGDTTSDKSSRRVR